MEQFLGLAGIVVPDGDGSRLPAGNALSSANAMHDIYLSKSARRFFLAALSARLVW
jgi:hypothetical protein